MDRIDVLAKCDELILRHAVKLREVCKRLVDSGALNLEEYEDNYRLPKIVLSAALRDTAADWRAPRLADDRREIERLSHF